MFSSAKPNENERSACEQVPMARNRKPERWFLEVPNCFCHVSKLFSTFGTSGRKRVFQQLASHLFTTSRTLGETSGCGGFSAALEGSHGSIPTRTMPPRSAPPRYPAPVLSGGVSLSPPCLVSDRPAKREGALALCSGVPGESQIRWGGFQAAVALSTSVLLYPVFRYDRQRRCLSRCSAGVVPPTIGAL
jgi:hypothetical protein